MPNQEDDIQTKSKRWWQLSLGKILKVLSKGYIALPSRSSRDVSEETILKLSKEFEDVKRELEELRFHSRQAIKEFSEFKRAVAEVQEQDNIVTFPRPIEKPLPPPEDPVPPEPNPDNLESNDNRNIFTSLVPKYEVVFGNLNLVPFPEENLMKKLNLTNGQKWLWRIPALFLIAGAAAFLYSDYSTIALPPTNSLISAVVLFLVGLQGALNLFDKYDSLRQDIRVALLLLAIILFFVIIAYFKGLAALGGSISVFAWLAIPVLFWAYYDNIVDSLWRIHSEQIAS